MDKRKIIALCLSLLIAATGFARSLSIQVVQNNPAATEDQVFAVSDWVEQNVIDFFFETGNIVTTSPIVLYNADDSENKKNLMTALKETFMGGMDTLIRIKLDYNEEKDNPNLLLLDYIKNATWIIYDARSGKELASGECKVPKVTVENNNENGIRNFAANMAGDLSRGLLSVGKK